MRAGEGKVCAGAPPVRKRALGVLFCALWMALGCTSKPPEEELELPDDGEEHDSGATDDSSDAGEEPVDGGELDAMQERPAEVPETAHCDRVDEWDATWSQFEDEILLWTNEARIKGYDCGTHGVFAAAQSLTMEPRLRCAARMHALYMAEVADDFEHVTRAGVGPDDRVEQAGYDFEATGENIAVGQLTPKQVVDGWLESDGHCANMMEPLFDEIGIGYAEGHWETGGLSGTIEAPYWVQNFGKER